LLLENASAAVEWRYQSKLRESDENSDEDCQELATLRREEVQNTLSLEATRRALKYKRAQEAAAIAAAATAAAAEAAAARAAAETSLFAKSAQEAFEYQVQVALDTLAAAVRTKNAQADQSEIASLTAIEQQLEGMLPKRGDDSDEDGLDHAPAGYAVIQDKLRQHTKKNRAAQQATIQRTLQEQHANRVETVRGSLRTIDAQRRACLDPKRWLPPTARWPESVLPELETEPELVIASDDDSDEDGREMDGDFDEDGQNHATADLEGWLPPGPPASQVQTETQSRML
jgi:hypothetical protein